MKQQTFILIIFLLISCRVKKITNTQQITFDNLEAGKCWFTLQSESKTEKEFNIFQKSFILEEVPPKYEKIETKYSSKDLMNEMKNKDYLSIKTLEAHTRILIKEANLSEFTTIRNPKGFMYCLIEVPSEWKTVFKKDLLQDSLKIVKKAIIEDSKILKTYIDRIPKKLMKNQFFFKSGNWTTPKEAIADSCSGMGNQFVYDLKKRLIELGYDLQLNYIVGSKTKNAIIDFQRKNNLKEGKIDFETLDKLGVKY